MHKITKGLKKKKKGKKSKHKEEDLFKPEELEAYRREHQEAEASGATGENEEWKKFKALTSGVDDILKKTQGDLDRIKSTSFFQRVPPPSELKKQEEAELAQAQPTEEEKQLSEVEAAIVAVSESESEEEEEDDIFDTSYIDALAAAELKLAYIPESPTEQTAADDPFDTSYAERAILGPAVAKKGKKLVPIGSAVEVLTGRVQAPTCAVKRPTPRRQILKEQNLLLGSFDDNANAVVAPPPTEEPVKLTLLDEDAPLPLQEEAIDLSKNLQQTVVAPPPEPESKSEEPDEDDEFAQLASESLTKNPAPIVVEKIPESVSPQVLSENWSTLAQADNSETNLDDDLVVEDDPFDTTFAENILPGRAELKVIEKEILNADSEFEYVDKYADLISKVSISVTDPTGQRESISSLDKISEDELNTIKPIHRDLLGGSSTDLTTLSDPPLQPAEKQDENYIEYCDPFDTSIINTIAPGQTELKILEKELLGDIHEVNDDDDFDPRAEEPKPIKQRQSSRPDVLDVVKTVSFDLPSPEGIDEGKAAKPLTPYYVRKGSIAEEVVEEELDPFDTSFVGDVAPGKAELKVIEKDLFGELKRSYSDPDFDPRDEKKVAVAKVVQEIEGIYNPVVEEKVVDLLAVEEELKDKVLTPVKGVEEKEEIGEYIDPFDTSSANLLPGRTELKLLESELISSRSSPGDDLLASTDLVIHQPLSPIKPDDIDPFDTSFASNIAPGRTELKLLESELI